MDNTIYELSWGEWARTRNSIHTTPYHPNFLITYKGKDWSGFRTLGECEAQMEELRDKNNDFQIVERI